MNYKFVFIIVALLFASVQPSMAQRSRRRARTTATRTPRINAPQSILDWASNYRAVGLSARDRCAVTAYSYDAAQGVVRIEMNEVFGRQQWTAETPQRIYDQVRRLLPANQRNARIVMTVDFDNRYTTDNRPIEHLAPYAALDTVPRLLQVDYQGVPWVKNLSRPYAFDYGLEGRHISLWAGHGRYYSNRKECWEWQRDNWNGIREDVNNPRIAIELVTPMLEGAGAIVWSPRERCASTTEIIVDNDIQGASSRYVEVNGRQTWSSIGTGFAPIDTLRHGDNPFKHGTARMIYSESDNTQLSSATWYPQVERSERLAVYVSYQTLVGSTEHAIYSIHHGGIVTNISVNQRMGGGTWVYLGEYLFNPDAPDDNCIVLTNKTRDGGVVTADAVRIGGGMGNVLRGGSLSGLSRYDEGARYSMQWAGMPDSIYAVYDGDNDYNEDINVRSLATNLLCGGSVYNPDAPGLGVPFELTISMHTDAGVDNNGGVVGSLGIATTFLDGERLPSGCSRLLSRDLAEEVLASVAGDMQHITGRWNRRHLLDRNYSETRRPVVPATIIEIASHENALDAMLLSDPDNRFHIARAIYKGILRFIHKAHNLPDPIIQPLPVRSLAYDGSRLTWMPSYDSLEPSAHPACYLVQVALDGADFDNGQLVSVNTFSLNLQRGQRAVVRVRAINAGGAGMPTDLTIN